jgi:hypothetical protein
VHFLDGRALIVAGWDAALFLLENTDPASVHQGWAITQQIGKTLLGALSV